MVFFGEDWSVVGKGERTMLPISVEPRAQAKRISRQPPRENSLAEVPVPPRSWRVSMGLAAARPASREMRTAWVYMMLKCWWELSI
jgi:hypothetical protein